MQTWEGVFVSGFGSYSDASNTVSTIFPIKIPMKPNFSPVPSKDVNKAIRHHLPTLKPSPIPDQNIAYNNKSRRYIHLHNSAAMPLTYSGLSSLYT